MVKNYKIKAAVPGYLLNLQFLIFSLKKRASIVMPINKIIFLFVFFAGLLFLSCNPSEPGNAPAGLEFKAEDASCTEAWLTLKAGNITGAKVFREDSLIYSFNTNSIDTTLFDEGLLPNQIYKYHTVIQPSNNSRVVTKELTLQTMDTTSHNFTWQTFTFGGDAGSSALNDVAIIDENNIWAVGEIYLKDSLGTPDPHAYNAVHWDGQTWKLFKLQFFTFCGQSYTSSYPAKAIYAFDSENIIISSNSQLTYLRNEKQIRTECVSVSVNKIWGTSSSDLYIAGNNGSIAHYDGSSSGSGWTKIESGTQMLLTDIYGDNNNIYIAAADVNHGSGAVLKVDNLQISTLVESDVVDVSDIFKPKLFGATVAVWVDEKNTLYTGCDLFYRYKLGKWDYVKSLIGNYIGGNNWSKYWSYIGGIRGNQSNDLWICGERNTLRHFNGVSWQQIGNPYNPDSYLVWRGLAVKDNITVVVGNEGTLANIMLLKRN